MMEFTDYQQQIRGVNRIRNTVINATMRLVCYDQVFYDDSRLEAAEYIGLALEVREFESSVMTIVEPGYENAAILILDDDGELIWHVFHHKKLTCLIKTLVYSGCGWSK